MDSLNGKVLSFIPTIKEVGAENCRLYETIQFESGEKRLYKKRIFLHHNQICVYNKGSSRRGTLYSPEENSYVAKTVDVKLHIIKRQSLEIKWRKSWERVIKLLEKSGWWEQSLKTYRDGLEIGLDKIKDAYAVEYGDDRVEKIKAIDARLVRPAEGGGECMRTSILWYMTSPAKVKKMYFGKYDNARKLKEIKNLVDTDTAGRVYGQSSYDVHFSYNPDKKMAWYAEEFRGCGNGHYYIALNSTHALFVEDD